MQAATTDDVYNLLEKVRKTQIKMANDNTWGQKQIASVTTHTKSGRGAHVFSSSATKTVVGPDPDIPTYKITITISTTDLGSGESLELRFYVGSSMYCNNLITIADGTDIKGQTYVFCFRGDNFVSLDATATDGFYVFWNYLLEYAP